MMPSQQDILTLIIFFIASTAAVAVFDRNTTRPYVVKKNWVENFVRFQYVFEKSCVPTNRDDGDLLDVGKRFIDTDFVFACEENEDGVMSYDAVVPPQSSEIAVGERREEEGREKQKKISPTVNATQLTGRLMECFRPHHSYYESHVIGRLPLKEEHFIKPREKNRSIKTQGEKKKENQNSLELIYILLRPAIYSGAINTRCAIGRIGVRFDEFVELDLGKYAQCEQDDTGNVKLRPVQLDGLGEIRPFETNRNPLLNHISSDLSCTHNNRTYAHLSTWTDNERGARMTCNYGNLQKT
ncbi:hypothetical protein OSTOST_18029, partial [Ostertagia ostertagi]